MMMTSAAKERVRPVAPSSGPIKDFTDEQLLLQYRNSGDRQLFRELVRRYEGELYNYLRRYLGNAEMAEDVFQTTFLQVHLKHEQFQEGRKFRPWLYTIATNQAIDAQRSNKRHRNVSLDQTGSQDDSGGAATLAAMLVSDETDPLARVTSEEDKQWIGEAMDQLSDPMRDVVQLVYYQGLKYREAAEVLSVPVGTVKSRLNSAISKLTESWNNSHVDQN